MRVAKIRGEESFGMICAEDEIGLGTSHDGIMVLAADTVVGTPAATLFEPYQDWVYEIGLTPNRMDAMSHYGVAKDVCAYLTHHEKEAKPVTPFPSSFAPDQNNKTIAVSIENEAACKRYAGIELTGVKVSDSPSWLKNRLTAIGVRPINNIVDVTNYILHETGQPLHAFDAAAIRAIIDQPGCVEFRTYYGMKEDLGVCLVFFGVDKNGNNIIHSGNGGEDVIVEYGKACPPDCPTGTEGLF